MENEDFSCIKEVTKIVNLTLPSMCNTNEISGICDALDSWKRQYVKQLQGIVVGYKNVSLTSKRGYLKVDSPVIYCNVKATFELFHPSVGSIIKGKINRISQDYIGCLVHDTINVTVHQPVDISTDVSQFIGLDNFILFQISRINFKSKFIHVKGIITDECITLMKESGLFNENPDVCSNNRRIYSSPDFSRSNNNYSMNDNVSDDNTLETMDFDTATDASSQNSSQKKKKKHKKSKKHISMSPLSGSLENDVDQVELTSPKKSKKGKHKTINSSSPVLKNDSKSMHVESRIKSEKPTFDENQFELNEFSDKIRKRKRKKSDQNLATPIDAVENEIEPVHIKKKRKIDSEIKQINDTVEAFQENSSFMSSTISHSDNISNISSVASDIDSPNIAEGIENLAVKTELFSPVKKKKHKKSKKSLEVTTSVSDYIVKTEINTNDMASLSPISQGNASENLDLKPDARSLTSPDLFDEPLTKVKIEAEGKSKKKKKESASNKSKTNKKKKDKFKKDSKKDKLKKDSKKDKLKRDSKKDKKKKLKVISTKKKLHGHNKLKKKKNKDKKSKNAKENKSKTKKSKNVPE